MSACTRNDTLRSLQLPDPFEDLTGLIGSDLKVIARHWRNGRAIGLCSRHARRGCSSENSGTT